MRELALPDVRAYRAHLERAPDEWAVLDRLCWIPISRFYRDRSVFEFLERTVLPELSAGALEHGDTEMRCWSAGSAAGEEPYTLAMIWKLRVAAKFPTLRRLRVLATEIDPDLIGRARTGCYPVYSVNALPADITAQAFRRSPSEYCVRDEIRADVDFVGQDIRRAMPDERFHLILCRNLVLTYFEEALQRAILDRMTERLLPGGAMIFGLSEPFPDGVLGLEPWSERLRVYRRRESIAAPLPLIPRSRCGLPPHALARRRRARGASGGGRAGGGSPLTW
jgi:chemotaxis protein methyltransferase CheR